MRCVLHVGVSKTGTTSIQQVLRRNRGALARRGVLSPECLGPNHAGIGLFAQDDDRVRPWHNGFPRAAVDNRAGFRADLTRALTEEAEASGADTLLIVCEFLSGLQRAQEFERLSALLRGICDEVEVVAYLRRQDRHLESEYTTTLFSRRKETRPLVELERRPRDYHLFLETWRVAFAPDRLSPRVFQRDCLAEGDVVLDYFRTAGVAPPPAYNGARRANASVSPTGQEAMRQVNLLLNSVAEADAAGVKAARTLAREEIRQRFKGSGQRLPGAAAAEMLRAVAAGNGAVARTYFGRDELFAPLEDSPAPVIDKAAVEDILRKVRAELSVAAA